MVTIEYSELTDGQPMVISWDPSFGGFQFSVFNFRSVKVLKILLKIYETTVKRLSDKDGTSNFTTYFCISKIV